MHVHRCVGEVTFVACDVILGREGSAADTESMLDKLQPDTLVVDLSVRDLEQLEKGELADPFRSGIVDALADQADEDPLAPYARTAAWADDHGISIRPIGPRARQGWIQTRRVRKVMSDVEAPGPEALARQAVQALLKDDRVGELAERHRRNLAESLTNLLAQEPPRTVAVFAFPWGEMVSSDVRRSMGLRRLEGDDLSGGWPG